MSFSFDFFDALRRMKERTSRASSPNHPSQHLVVTPLPKSIPVTIGDQGIALIKHFESCAKRRRDARFEAYPDPATGGAPWTIGWGATGADIVPGTVWTQAECDARLERDLIRYAAEVARALGNAATDQNQFDALVSFHYNTGAIAKASLTRLHRAGQHDAAAREFGKWVNAGGKPMAGLVRRRAAEARLYSKGYRQLQPKQASGICDSLARGGHS